MKYGVEVSIDVTKIDKSRLYEGKNGAKYLTMTTFIDTENPNEFGNHGFISEKQTREESESKTYTTILGNVKVFWEGESQQQQPPQQNQGQQIPQNNQREYQDDAEDD